jgi:hypothetical protein
MSRADLSDPEIKKAFDDIKSSTSQTNYVLFGYVPKSDTKLKVVETGTGGLAEVSDQLNNAGKVQFALVAFDINKTKKFVYISWCGEAVTGMKKGLFNNHANDVAAYLKGFHVQINARSEGDLDEKKIIERLKKASGASYDSGQKNQGNAELVPKSVQQGKTQATQSNVQRNAADKSDYNKKNESDQYWTNQRQTEEQDKQSAQARQLPRAEYNKTSEREQFWAQQKQEEPKPAPTRQQPQGSGNSGNVKAKFENQNQQQSAPPPRQNAPPPGKKPAPQHEAPKPPPVQEEVPPPEAEAPPAPQEEPQQQWNEQPQETPVEPEQSYQEPAPEEPAQQQFEEPPQQQFEEPTQDSGQENYEQNNEQVNYDQSSGGGSGGVGQCKALYDYGGDNEGDLAFKEGDIITILDKSDPSGWYEGELNGIRGFFPSNFVEEF